ncbi:MAG TPA: (Fe-S)-binding protein [Egibacteraceae bacterium]|nr:(Fe-S)-binding protein [Egibacteraceae bacterium]
MRRPELPTIADVRADAEHCSYNAKLCRFACPVATATGKESVTPWGINRALTAAAKAGAVSEATAAAVYGCTGCRSCGSVCLPGLDLPTHVRAARADVVAAGLAPAGVERAAGRACPPADELVAGATPGAGTVVYPGCRSGDGPALAALLRAAEEPYDVVAGATCCGARSVDVGHAERGMAEAADLAGRLQDATAAVVADPHCARWLRVDHADPRVVALPSFLAGLVDRLTPHLSAPPDRPVAWHDPCWLARGMAIHDDPRTVLAATGAPVVEPPHTRDHTGCTGGGMGYPEADPAGAEAILSARADELRLALGGAGTVVTACPNAAERLRGAGLDAHDLAGWLATRLDTERP